MRLSGIRAAWWNPALSLHQHQRTKLGMSCGHCTHREADSAVASAAPLLLLHCTLEHNAPSSHVAAACWTIRLHLDTRALAKTDFLLSMSSPVVTCLALACIEAWLASVSTLIGQTVLVCTSVHGRTHVLQP
jgi:hypothetical protein